MGEVYRARDERLKRDVAIKVLPASYSRDADRLRRFEHEAQAAGGLNHPNITAVHDVGTAEDGSPYVVQELLEGETLRSILSGGRLSTRKAIDHALQVAHGLAAAHEKGIVHRDLKPENLFVTEDGRVKILDFGLAKLIQSETASSPQTSIPTASRGTEPGVVMGTAGYMSPEQVKGLPADHRSDIFSFGAILYEMLSGRRAFKGDSAVETMSAILKEDPPELSDTNKNVSDGLERLVRHCLEKAPAQRFQSARDLAYDLDALTGVSGATASPRGPRSGPRFNLRRLVLAGAALVAAAVCGWLLKGATQKPSSPSYRAVTFRQGFVAGARFAPDGQTIVYSASWDGGPYRIYSTQSGSTESRDLGLPSGDLLSVSSTGEMAVSLGRKNIEVSGTLARVPLAGGAPRVLLEDVFLADWSPDGKDLAIVRIVGGMALLEYPMGKTLYKTADVINGMRFSPKGDSIAVLEENTDGFSTVCVVDLSGKVKTLTKGWPFAHGLAWPPDAGEVWFSAAERTGSNEEEIHAVTLSGRERLVRRESTPMTISDISRDGRALVLSGEFSNGMMYLAAGETVERPVPWLDSSQPDALSPDGRTLLFDEWGRGGGANGAVYIRRLDEPEAVRLTEGTGLALSADGRWVLASSREGLALIPTGPGKPRPLGGKGLEVSFWGGCLQGENLAYFKGNEPGQPQHLFQLDLSREARPTIVSPEEVGGRTIALSPDGKLLASEGPDKRVRLYPVDGGRPRLVPGVLVHEQPVQFSTDGRSLYLYEPSDVPSKVHRVDLETGRRELWKELAPADRTAVIRISRVVMTPDARTYAYSFNRFPVTLFVAEGLH